MILVLIPSLFLAIEASWRRPYLGDNAVEFVRALNGTCRSVSQRHSNTTFLIQSSDSGNRGCWMKIPSSYSPFLRMFATLKNQVRALLLSLLLSIPQ